PAPQAIAWRASLPVSQFDQPTLASEYFGRQFAAVLTRHCSFHAFNDGRDWAAIVYELLGAVLDHDASALADVLVVRAFVGVLKTPPTAHVINKNCFEVG